MKRFWRTAVNEWCAFSCRQLSRTCTQIEKWSCGELWCNLLPTVMSTKFRWRTSICVGVILLKFYFYFYFPTNRFAGIIGLSSETVVTCMREVDNARPYFVGTLGERYGSYYNAQNAWVKADFERAVREEPYPSDYFAKLFWLTHEFQLDQQLRGPISDRNWNSPRILECGKHRRIRKACQCWKYLLLLSWSCLRKRQGCCKY